MATSAPQLQGILACVAVSVLLQANIQYVTAAPKLETYAASDATLRPTGKSEEDMKKWVNKVKNLQVTNVDMIISAKESHVGIKLTTADSNNPVACDLTKGAKHERYRDYAPSYWNDKPLAGLSATAYATKRTVEWFAECVTGGAFDYNTGNHCVGFAYKILRAALGECNCRDTPEKTTSCSHTFNKEQIKASLLKEHENGRIVFTEHGNEIMKDDFIKSIGTIC